MLFKLKTRNRTSLHPDACRVLESTRLKSSPPVYELPIDEARDNLVQKTKSKNIIEMWSVTNREIVLSDRFIKIRIYQPSNTSGLPLLVFFHGGCWVIGDLDTHDNDCRSLAKLASCVVVSVDYRLAPEHPFPCGVEDAYEATMWSYNNAIALGANPLLMFVGGVSAGGNLAAAVAIMSQDRSGPPLAGQMLVYPITDCDLTRKSYRKFGKGYLLTKKTMKWSWEQYAPELKMHPWASPIRALSHRRLPPCLMMVANCDPLRDEGVLYAETLKSSGVPVQLRVFEGQIHAFFSAVPPTSSSIEAQQEAATWINETCLNFSSDSSKSK